VVQAASGATGTVLMGEAFVRTAGFCSTAFLCSFAGVAAAQEIECGAESSALPESSVFVGYTRPGESVLRSAALVTRGNIAPYDGRHLAAGDVLYAALPGTDSSLEVANVSPYLNQLGSDHCVYRATLAGPAQPDWQIWTSDRLAGEFRTPSAEEEERLRSYQPNCIQQGDRPEDARPPCVRAQLLAVSDLDGDEALEFWHSAPYTWDTGLSVLEESELEPVLLVAACPGCSD
jgi:hypothetical protein